MLYLALQIIHFIPIQLIINIFHAVYFTTFGHYLINLNIIACLVFLLLSFKRPQFIGSDVLKKSAILNIRLFIFAAILALLGELFSTYQMYYLNNSANEYENQAFLKNDRLFGKYLYGYWGYSLFYLLAIILMFIKPIRQNYFFSFIVMLLSQAVLMFNRFIIIVTSSHRDYIPSSWTMYFNWKAYLLCTVLPGLMFSCLLILFFKRKNPISKDKT